MLLFLSAAILDPSGEIFPLLRHTTTPYNLIRSVTTTYVSDPTLKTTELLGHGVNEETVITTSYVELTDKLGAITDVFKLVEWAHLMDRITIHHLVRQKKIMHHTTGGWSGSVLKSSDIIILLPTAFNKTFH